jgi:transaldolase
MNRIVFLDRDGVLNRCNTSAAGPPLPPSSLSALSLLPGAPQACHLLKNLGYRLVIVTNQPDIARGTQSRETVDAMNAWVADRLDIDDVRMCVHDDADRCDCRKPQPGLLVRAAADAGVALKACFMVGDRWKDIDAGRRAGCRTVLIGDGYGEQPSCCADHRAPTLLDVARWIASQQNASADEGESMTTADLGIRLFADGADVRGMLEMYEQPFISGFTTNPTLMRKAGVADYLAFAREVLDTVKDKPISFEVFSDDFRTMEREAYLLAGLADNVYVKIPVTNSGGVSSSGLLRRLVRQRIKVNVTALLTLEQVETVVDCLDDTPSCVSIFAGRIADTGRDPVPIVTEALRTLRSVPNAELIWASPRELLNVIQAAAIGCHIITATNDIIKKLPLLGKDLTTFSLETVQMFHHDARAAGYELGDAPVGSLVSVG